MITTTQKIPSEYKQTEIGVIPADWDVKKLGEVADYKNGKSFESRITDIGDYFLITLNSLDIKGKLKSDHLRVSVSDKSLNKNDLVMILSDVAHGNFLGLADVVPEDDKYVLNQRVGALKNIRYLTPYYLSKYINFKQKYFKTAGQGSSQLNLSKGDILAFPVVYPNLETEQSAISMTISDAEVLIEKLERLVEKKKNIKQGAMQELLTGKRRLTGFGGKWEVKRLGDVAEMSSGGTPSSGNPLYYGGKIPWVVIADMTRITKYLFETEKKITTQGLENSSAKIFPSGTLLFAMYASIGKCAIAKVDVTCNQAILGIKTKNIDTEFLYYYLSFNEQTFLQMGQSGTQNNLNKEIVENLKIPYPQIPEQKAISAVLSDMDVEIEKLESQLTKYQNIKQGMMQTLLTGKIRLLTK